MTRLAKYLLVIFILLLVVTIALIITNVALEEQPPKIETSQADTTHFEVYLNGTKIDPNNSVMLSGVSLAIRNLDSEYSRIISDFGLNYFPVFELRIFNDFDLYVKDQKLKNPEKDIGILDSRVAEGSIYNASIIFYYLPESFAKEPTSEVAVIPTHEFVHLIQNRFIKNVQSKVPPEWFREGGATYESKMVTESSKTVVKNSLSKGENFKYIDLQELNGPPTNPTLFYPTVGLFYQYLVKNYSVLKVNSIFATCGDGEEFDKAFEEITQKSPEVFYNDWLSSL